MDQLTWHIVACGESYHLYDPAICVGPTVMVNRAGFKFPGAFNYWCIIEHSFMSEVMEYMKKVSFHNPIFWLDENMKDHFPVNDPSQCKTIWADYFTMYKNQFNKEFPFRTHQQYTQRSFSIAIGRAVIKGAKRIRCYGMDFEGYGYLDQVQPLSNLSNPETINKIENRWRFERTQFRLILKDLRRNGIDIRRVKA